MYLLETTVTSEPAAEPIDNADIKELLEISHTSDDTELTQLAKSARIWVENYCGRAMITQTRKAYFVDYEQFVLLPYSPIQSVTSVTRKRYDESDLLTADSDYYVQGNKNMFIRMISTETLNTKPGHSPKDRISGWDLEIVYVCGYGDDDTDVPQDLREAMTELAAHWYESPKKMQDIPQKVYDIIDGYKVIEI